jgi:hypothetical protein
VRRVADKIWKISLLFNIMDGTDESVTGNTSEEVGTSVHAFVVTARSLTPKRAQRVVQSVYVTLEQP